VESRSVRIHERRTPITLIAGHAQGLLRRPPQPAALLLIQQEAQRMGTLVTDLLDMARNDSGRLHLRPSLVWSMAVGSLRLRLARSLLTVLTIAVATAFLVYLLILPAGTDTAEINNWRLTLALALLVSAAGVLNTLLMAVTQRYREIGTLKCLGELDSFVLLSVLLEAMLLGLVGALVGVLLGTGIALGLGALRFGTEVWTQLDWAGLPTKSLIAVAVGLGLAFIGAAIPALIASRMAPMEAMRGEK
jgi:hypothetical protein